MSYKVYEVTQTELSHDGYKVKINGENADVDAARVSTVPFNRRWPGHQRQIDQTELINFVSLETDEALNFEIIPKTPAKKAVIRPASLGITPEITADGRILFTLEKPAYFTLEPYGKENALHIFADPVSKYEIDKLDENVIYFGRGIHNPEMINLKSNQTLFIDEGAVVYTCVHAIDAENIKILGRGILDNSKNKEKILFEANEEDNFAAVDNAVRVHTLHLEYCKNIKIEGITVRDSLQYTIRPVGCENIDIENVKVIGNWRYNSDGIDMHNCVNAVVNNCFLRTFDDSVCVKGFDFYYDGDLETAVREAMYRNGKSYDVFKNVHVKNCVIWNDWGKCLEIGAETRAEEICDIVFENCDIIHVSCPVIDVMNVDYADIHDVVFRNINIEFDDILQKPGYQKTDEDVYVNTDVDHSPTLISSIVMFHEEYSKGGKRRGKNRNFTYENINLYGRQKIKMHFAGYDDDHQVSDMVINGLYQNGKLVSWEDCNIFTNEFCQNIKIK